MSRLTTISLRTMGWGDFVTLLNHNELYHPVKYLFRVGESNSPYPIIKEIPESEAPQRYHEIFSCETADSSVGPCTDPLTPCDALEALKIIARYNIAVSTDHIFDVFMAMEKIMSYRVMTLYSLALREAIITGNRKFMDGFAFTAHDFALYHSFLVYYRNSVVISNSCPLFLFTANPTYDFLLRHLFDPNENYVNIPFMEPLVVRCSKEHMFLLREIELPPPYNEILDTLLELRDMFEVKEYIETVRTDNPSSTLLLLQLGETLQRINGLKVKTKLMTRSKEWKEAKLGKIPHNLRQLS